MDNVQRKAVRFIILLGLVSLFSDITYEGARSVTGPFLGQLGASGTVVGFVAGFGEFIGYGLRLVSGYFADRTARYWFFTGLGYALNLIAVPALALAGKWQVAALLVVMERFGKALRTPARDAMISYAGSRVGRGRSFAIHEALDQVGAVAGPLIVSAAVFVKGDFRAGFAILAIPATLALVTLLVAGLYFPRPQELERTPTGKSQLPENNALSHHFWLYNIFIALAVAGFANFQLISYHLEGQAVVPGAYIPVFFAVAMGVDALAALLAGRLYDRVGIASLLIVPVLTIPVPFFAFTTNYSFVLLGIVLWGVILGLQETIIRAAVADMVSSESRGTAYGIFNTVFGISWFLGSAIMGALYDLSTSYVQFFVIGAEAVALLFFVILHLRRKMLFS